MDEPFGNPMADMLAADGAVTAPSVMGELMRDRFEGDRRIRQVESRWVESSGRFGDAGHWEEVEVIDVGPAPA
jgi:hypothetical protein